MNVILKVIGALKPFKELITIVVFLIGSAYAAMTHFATAQQLSDARASLEALQKRIFFCPSLFKPFISSIT